MILLSDVLGLAMLTIGINAPPDPSATGSTVLGPFFIKGASRVANGADTFHGAPGEPYWVQGRVTRAGGQPIAGAIVKVWEADEDGLYDVSATRGRLDGCA